VPAAPQEYTRLTAAVRRLLDAATHARPLDASTLDAATGAIDRATDDLVAARDEITTVPRHPEHDGQRAAMPVWEYEQDDEGLVVRGTFTAAHTGPPDSVHGGYVAGAFDEVLGWACAKSGNPAVTGKLTVRYRRATPLDVPVEFRAAWPRVAGKRVHVHATLTAAGDVTAEADGLFVLVDRRAFAPPPVTGDTSTAQER
jgi:acyl-coenzyme A thioesterase PaaI-like protein